MTDAELKWHIEESKKLRRQAEGYSEDAPGAMVEVLRLLTAAQMLMGRVSAQMDGDHAKIYAARKNTHARTKRDAARGDKTLAAELAVMELREFEAEALERKMFWQNELDALKQKMYELRLRIRQDMHVGGGYDG